MRIYKVRVEHTKYGRNWGSFKVSARTFELARRKAQRTLRNNERIESLELLEATA